jgi:propionyl-CoA carboxylase alpha chain
MSDLDTISVENKEEVKHKKPHFDSILVANRGEVALRIIRTLKKMNIRSVAVYSEADANALHVQMADEAYYIGNSPATESYLSIQNIITAAKQSGAQAVHPGYGFLSENPKFASKLKVEGIHFIGPSAGAIKIMGDKIEAKKIAIEAKVSVVPGYIGIISTVSKAVEIAEEIGFPVIVKAAAGGGGRGMRVVYNKEEMVAAFESARIEAANSFNDNRVFIEKFIIKTPRHIEIQVLADKYGNIVCLGERECSIQRNHQKVIEETPSICISEETRQEMYRQSISLVKKVNYHSAGTIEFMLDGDGRFYFLEMNTRLQVEHTVTEMVTGIDIVEEMISISAGEKLSLTQENVSISKHAVECRVCAEDPTRGFLPSSGRITEYREPTKSPNIRIDTSLSAGIEVSVYYDTMIAKLCTIGDSREEAIKHMLAALSALVIRGINHNISFLEALISHPKFVTGEIHTGFIAEEYPQGFGGAELTSEISQIFVATAIHIFITEQKRLRLINERVDDQTNKIMTRWVVTVDNISFPVVIKPMPGGYNIRQGSNRIEIRSNWSIGNRLFVCKVNGKNLNVRIEHIPTGYKLTHAGVATTVYVRSPKVSELERFMTINSVEEIIKEVYSPLGGQIIDVKVNQGDTVKESMPLLTLAAIKMENIIKAPMNGVIKKIHVTKQQIVRTGDLLIEYE